jgi:c(7)-type cytochrome triheme protein
MTATRTSWPARVVVMAAGLLLASALGAQTLPKLPGPMALPRSADSPGQVTFNHTTHVDDAKPTCTTCHPRLFSILKDGAPAPRVAIVHAKMEKGQQCGACHDGKKAFAIEDDCAACHSEK